MCKGRVEKEGVRGGRKRGEGGRGGAGVNQSFITAIM
jgi:hypothetical protein